MLTKQYMKILSDSITQVPLLVGELRRLTGLGRRFLALKATKVDQQYHESASFTFEEQDYVLYTKLGDQR